MPILLPAWSGAIAGETYRIEPYGGGDFATIQAAVEAAGPHDVNVLGRSITIRSESGDPQSCIIDCQGSREEFHRAFLAVSGEGLDCVLEGFTITGGYVSDMGTVIDSWSGAPTLSACRIVNSTFVGNQGSSGIFAWSYPVELDHALIAFNPNVGVINADAMATLVCCDLYGNGADWSGPIGDQLGVNGNISADPQLCSEAPHEHGNWGLQSDSPCIEPRRAAARSARGASAATRFRCSA